MWSLRSDWWLTWEVFGYCITSCNPTVKPEKETEKKSEFEVGVVYDALFKNVISGDFDGDGKEDKLKESLVSSVNNKAIDVLPHLEYDSLVALIHTKKPVLSLQSVEKNIPELTLTKEASFGVMWIKNEGDLNQDGTDEISVVIDWADWSQVNSCIVYSLKKDKWVEYAKFEVREWQISPDVDFRGFISKNEKGFYEVLTFDSETNEVLIPLDDVLVAGE